jgi:hypothetical protein
MNKTIFQRIKQTLRNLVDVHRQAEINRLITRASRRCARDFSHALDHIPESDPNLEHYRERVNMWKETFWDHCAYRDQLHHEIWALESKIDKLERQLRGEVYDPEEDIPF